MWMTIIVVLGLDPVFQGTASPLSDHLGAGVFETRDAMGEPLADGAWALSLQVKPFVRCIWLGALMVGIGGLLAATDRRYRRRRQSASNNEVAL